MLSSSSPSHGEYLKRKRRRKLFLYGTVFFAFVLLVSLISYLSYRSSIRISKIELSGGVLVTQADVESKALSYMRGSYIWLFPKNNILWYPKESLKNYLKDTFKRIDTIYIERKNLKTLTIAITERKPVANWCEGGPGEVSSESVGTEASTPKCYFLDQNGTIFTKAPYFSGDAYFKYYGLIDSTSSLQVNSPQAGLISGDLLGQNYLASTTQFTEISVFISKVGKLGLKPQYLVAKDNGQFDLFIAGGGQIIFDLKKPLSIVVQNLTALLRLPALQINSDGILPVEYIDLRYGNKLFYKLK